ncbi:2041_t:CDS:10 [Gigaspora rosea]|nr:2041_t:CDS:10 [Gigaspora rosea]
MYSDWLDFKSDSDSKFATKLGNGSLRISSCSSKSSFISRFRLKATKAKLLFTLMEDLIATSLGEYFYNPVSEYFKTRPHEEWSDEGCVSWVLESTTRHKIISEFYKALEVMKEHRRTPTEPRSIAKKLLKRKKASHFGHTNAFEIRDSNLNNDYLFMKADVEEANVEKADVAADDLDRDDEPEATSSDRKKRDRDGDTLCHSTSKKRAIDPELVSAEEALSFVPPHIKFSPGAPASKSTTSAVGKPPKEVRLWESFFEEVNGHTFDQVKNLQAPKFAYEYPFSKERSVCTAIDVNINSVLNSILGAEYDFSDRSPYVGDPDFTCYNREKLLLVTEIKRSYILEDLGARTFPEYYNESEKARTVIRQVYGTRSDLYFEDTLVAIGVPTGSIWKTNINELQSSAFRFLEDAVNTYIKVNPILSELKSEVLKDRHWKQLFKALELEIKNDWKLFRLQDPRRKEKSLAVLTQNIQTFTTHIVYFLIKYIAGCWGVSSAFFFRFQASKRSRGAHYWPLEKETEKENFLVSHRDLINKKGAEYEKNYTRSLENPTLPKMSEIGLLLSLSCVYAGGKVVQEIRKECNCEFFENLRDFTEDIGLNGLTGGLFNLGTQIAGHLAAREIARHGRKMINDAKVLIRVDQTIKVGSKVYATYEDTKEKIGYIVSTCHGHHKARGEVMTAIAQSIKDFVKISLL